MARFLAESDAGPREGFLAHCFSVAQANRALVLVKRIVTDLVGGYRRLMELQETVEAGQSGGRPARAAGDRIGVQGAHAELVRAAQRLHTCLQELDDVGVELRDFASGIVDFPCIVGGRYAYMTWRLGEPAVRYWHELGEGFAQRQPVGTMSGEQVRSPG